MQLTNQPLADFAFVTAFGAAWLVLCALLVTDYRGFLTWYTHLCWRFSWRLYRASGYRNENQVRRTFRGCSVVGLAMGAFVLVVEIAAIVTGHVV